MADVYYRYQPGGLGGVGTATGQVHRPQVSFGDIQDGPSIGRCVWTIPAVWFVWCWHSHKLGALSLGIIREYPGRTAVGWCCVCVCMCRHYSYCPQVMLSMWLWCRFAELNEQAASMPCCPFQCIQILYEGPFGYVFKHSPPLKHIGVKSHMPPVLGSHKVVPVKPCNMPPQGGSSDQATFWTSQIFRGSAVC